MIHGPCVVIKSLQAREQLEFCEALVYSFAMAMAYVAIDLTHSTKLIHLALFCMFCCCLLGSYAIHGRRTR